MTTETQPQPIPNYTRQVNRGNMPGHKSPLVQAVDWQHKLNEARDNDPKSCVPLAQGARAWLEVERLKREIRMQPKPRPVDVGIGGKRGARGKVLPAPVEDLRSEPAAAGPACCGSGPGESSSIGAKA